MNTRRERSALGKMIEFLEAQEDNYVSSDRNLLNMFDTSATTVYTAKVELENRGWVITQNRYRRGITDSTFTYKRPEIIMPKAPSRTARGQIAHWLRGEGRGVKFTISGLASTYNTTENNVSTLLRELRMNGWTIDQTGVAVRNSTKPHYIAVPPGGL